MEQSDLIAPDVLAELTNYVYVKLYTDRGDAENIANQQLEQKLMETTALPEYAAVSPDGKTLVAHVDGRAAISVFVDFLKKGRGAE